MQRLRVLCLGALIVVSACAPPPPVASPTVAPQNTDLTELRIGITGNSADAALFIAQDRGYFKEQGLKLSYTRVQSANDTVAPLGAGQLEIGGGAISAGLFNAMARGVEVKIVADKGQP